MRPESITESSELRRDWLFGQCRCEPASAQEWDLHSHFYLWPEKEETWFCLEGEKRSLSAPYDAGISFIGWPCPWAPTLELTPGTIDTDIFSPQLHLDKGKTSYFCLIFCFFVVQELDFPHFKFWRCINKSCDFFSSFLYNRPEIPSLRAWGSLDSKGVPFRRSQALLSVDDYLWHFKKPLLCDWVVQ